MVAAVILWAAPHTEEKVLGSHVNGNTCSASNLNTRSLVILPTGWPLGCYCLPKAEDDRSGAPCTPRIVSVIISNFRGDQCNLPYLPLNFLYINNNQI